MKKVGPGDQDTNRGRGGGQPFCVSSVALGDPLGAAPGRNGPPPTGCRALAAENLARNPVWAARRRTTSAGTSPCEAAGIDELRSPAPGEHGLAFDIVVLWGRGND